MSQTASDTDWTACKFHADDEVLHTPVREAAYNESVYFNFYCDDPGADGPLGGVLRVGLRPTDGYREMTLLAPLADGTTLFRYAREDFAFEDFVIGGKAFACGGMEIAVGNPTRTWRLAYHETARILSDLPAFGDAPGVAWRAAEDVEVDLDLTFEATHAMHTLSEDGGLNPAGAKQDEAARNHYEQFGRVTGQIGIGDRSYQLAQERSLRDHSWGPRAWDGMPLTDQVMAYFDDGTGLVSLNVQRTPGIVEAHGTAWTSEGGDGPVSTPGFDPIGAYAGESSVTDSLPLSLVVGDRRVAMTATVLSLFPTRVGKTHRDALTLVRLDGDLGPGAAWIDMMRPRKDA
jgi:hypothetical protein